MYVDDYLSTAKTVLQEITETLGLRDTLATGNLNLQGWHSNSFEFLQAVTGNVSEPASIGVTLAHDGEEKILWVIWDPKADTLGFCVGESTISYWRVGLLSQVASNEARSQGMVGTFVHHFEAAQQYQKSMLSLSWWSVLLALWPEPGYLTR